MIGSLLAMKFIGRKSWLISLYFWACVLFAGIIIGMIVPLFGIILAIAAFLLIAHYWFKLPWIQAITVWVVAIIIDIIIIFMIVLAFGISIWAYLGLEAFL